MNSVDYIILVGIVFAILELGRRINENIIKIREVSKMHNFLFINNTKNNFMKIYKFVKLEDIRILVSQMKKDKGLISIKFGNCDVSFPCNDEKDSIEKVMTIRSFLFDDHARNADLVKCVANKDSIIIKLYEKYDYQSEDDPLYTIHICHIDECGNICITERETNKSGFDGLLE